MGQTTRFLQLLSVLFVLIPHLIFGQGCPVTVSVETNPGTNICEDQTIQFTANPAGGSNLSYDWKVNGISYGTGKVISILGLKDQDVVKVEVTSSDSPGCKISGNDIHITVNPEVSGTAQIQASNRSICPGETVTFSISSITNPGAGAVYHWKLTRNGVTSILSTSNSYSNNNFLSGDKVQLFVEPGLPCLAPFGSNVIEFTERSEAPVIPAEISGSTLLCPGTSETYSIAPVPDATEYMWNLPTGWTGSGSTNQITVTAGTTDGTISVIAKNECGVSAASTLEVSAKADVPAAPGAISGAMDICPGTSETYQISPVTGATEYIWSLPAGWSGSSSTNSIQVTTGSSGSGTIEVQAKSECGTGTATTLPVTVRAGTPAVPEPVSGPSHVCPGIITTYSVAAVPGANEYTWILPAGWTGSSNSNSITVTTGTEGSTTISVQAINDCGTSSAQLLPVTVSSQFSASPGVIQGSKILCPGETSVFSVTEVPGASAYHWNIPSGWTIIQNSGWEISVKAGEQGETGNITVRAENSCATSTESSISVMVDPHAPATPGPISGPAEVCATESGIIYSVEPVQGATGYQWSFPPGWNVTAGEGTNSVTIDSSSADGEITVRAKNSCGESSEQKLNVKVFSRIPVQPGDIIVDSSSDFSTCQLSSEFFISVPADPDATAYRWTLPAGWEIVHGAGTRRISVRIEEPATTYSNASIKAQAINSCGESTMQSVESTICREGTGESGDFLHVVYVSNDCELIIRNPGLVKIDKVYLHNMLGQQLFEYPDLSVEEEIKLPVKKFAPGVYLARIHSEGRILTKQIVLE